MTEDQNVVLDLGSSSIKVGYNGESCPRLIIPNVIGKIKKEIIYLYNNDNKNQFEIDAIYNSSLYDLDYYQINHNGKLPIDNDLTLLEDFLNYILFKQLKIKTDNQNQGIFIITSSLTNQKEKEALCEIFFNKLGINKIYIESQSVMTLYSTAKTSGLIINSSEIINEIVPIYEGYVLQSGVKSTFKAGKELTNQFLNYYDNIFNYFNVENKFEMAKKIKENYCEILPFNERVENKENIDFFLPDGNSIEIGVERFNLPEIFFNNDGSDNHSIQEIIIESIDKTDLIFRKFFYDNMILGGGNSCIKGFPERLKSEIESYLKENNQKIDVKNIDLTYSSERKFSSWIGAAGVCSFNNFKNKWLTKENYEENGIQHLVDDFI